MKARRKAQGAGRRVKSLAGSGGRHGNAVNRPGSKQQVEVRSRGAWARGQKLVNGLNNFKKTIAPSSVPYALSLVCDSLTVEGDGDMR